MSNSSPKNVEQLDSSPKAIELTEEQRRKIELNRQSALKRKHAMLEEEKIKEAAAAAEASLTCQHKNDESGMICGNLPVAKDLRETFGELCCEGCRHLSDDFGLVNKADCASKYLLPQDTIKMMKFASRINPRNSGFAPMKLFLRKHVKEWSFKRWGDEDGLLKEFDRREKERFERGLVDCEDALDQGRRETLEETGIGFGKGSELSSVSELLSFASTSSREQLLAAEGDKDEEQLVPKKGRKAAKSSVVAKRSNQLGKMMMAIRGDKDVTIKKTS
jgi:hypothetical protein